MTDLKFKPVEAEDMKVLAPYFGLRPNKTCGSVPLDSFISGGNIIMCGMPFMRIRHSYG